MSVDGLEVPIEMIRMTVQDRWPYDIEGDTILLAPWSFQWAEVPYMHPDTCEHFPDSACSNDDCMTEWYQGFNIRLEHIETSELFVDFDELVAHERELLGIGVEPIDPEAGW